MGIGANVQRLREQRSLSQGELADAVKVHQSHISKIERGKKLPSIEVLQGLANYFGVTVDELLANQPQATTQAELA